MLTKPPMDPTPPTRMRLEEKTARRGLILGKGTGEVKRQLGLRKGEKENRGAVVKRKRSEPRRWREGREGGKGRRSQELERGSKAKDWLWKEEVLWMPKRKSHGEGEGEGGREVMIERHSLETEEKRTRDGIGRRERIDSVTSVFRALKFEDSGFVSDIIFLNFWFIIGFC